MPELTDLSVIRTLCEKYDFALSKGFGQNFIINPGLPPKIVDASFIRPALARPTRQWLPLWGSCRASG